VANGNRRCREVIGYLLVSWLVGYPQCKKSTQWQVFTPLPYGSHPYEFTTRRQSIMKYPLWKQADALKTYNGRIVLFDDADEY
jgi:hypothetical protein